MTDRPLPCIVCGQQLEPVFPIPDREDQRQPAGAVMFYAYGQYGSTVFDPQDGSQIQINVCDRCLLDRQERVWHLRSVRQPELMVFSKPWDPGREEPYSTL